VPLPVVQSAMSPPSLQYAGSDATESLSSGSLLDPQNPHSPAWG
jgi:hypothetical protein